MARGWLRTGPRGKAWFRRLAALVAVAAVAVIAPSVAVPAVQHAFTASYAGHGSGTVSGSSASGRVTATGRGTIIGRGRLTGSGQGVFTSPTCVIFSGTAVLKGTRGSITLATRRAKACAESPDANSVSFSGAAQVTGGTSTFAHARGTLAFKGTYRSQTSTVTISFRGRVRF
jgi:hypothetical protein